MILDEAYCEFNALDDPDASLDLLDRHPNLVLLRTFSKVYGLCGLRVGYALCGSEDFRTAVDQVRQPFFCNAAAQAAAIEALSHQDEVAAPRRAHARRAPRARGRARRLGHRARRLAGELRLVRPAAATTTRRRGRARVVEGLAERGILVRAGARWAAPARCASRSAPPAENARFLDALRRAGLTPR